MTSPSPRTALVTGGAKRLGRLMSLALAEDGWLLGIDSTFSSTTGEIRFGDQQEMGLGVRLATPLIEKNGTSASPATILILCAT